MNFAATAAAAAAVVSALCVNKLLSNQQTASMLQMNIFAVWTNAAPPMKKIIITFDVYVSGSRAILIFRIDLTQRF